MNWKKGLCLLLAAVFVCTLAACTKNEVKRKEGAETEEGPFVWTRTGYFTDEDGDLVSVNWNEDGDEPGWYVGIMLGDTIAGCVLPLEENALHGNVNGWDEDADPMLVTVTEYGADGIKLVVDGGKTYRLTPYELPKATIFVSVNTEGWGSIDYAEGGEAPAREDYAYQSAQINLAEPTEYTLIAWPDEGWAFEKWTKDGEDYSAEPVVTVLLDESADFVAVFVEDEGAADETEDGQNIVMNFIGPYVCDRARATVECEGAQDARVVIEWADSVSSLTRWILVGTLDEETLTVQYTDGIKSVVVFESDGSVSSEAVEYADGTGTITFTENGTFLWHEDQSDRTEDLVFEGSFEPEE